MSLPAKQHKQTGSIWVRLMVGLLALSWRFAGCSPASPSTLQEIVEPAQIQMPYTLPLDGAVGQTFIALYDGLNGIDVAMPAGSGAEGQVRMVLRTDPADGAVLAESTVDDASAAPFVHFSFDPIADSQGQRYYFYLDPSPASSGGGDGGALSVGADQPAAYWDGTAFIDHQPQAHVLSFRLHYGRLAAFGGVLAYLPASLLLILAAILVYVLPGLGLLALLLPEFWAMDWPTRLTLALGITLSVYPLILAWLHPLGLQLGAGNILLGMALGVAGLAWHYGRKRGRVPDPGATGLVPSSTAASVALLGVTLLLVGIRLWVVRMVAVPMWGDSVQHAAMAQRMLDNGGLFASWLPYAEFTTLTVHFGFHANVAALAWITGLDGVQATVIGGQFINVIAVLALYPLTRKVVETGREVVSAESAESAESGTSSQWGQWSGVVAVLVVGLLTSMPAFYVNWGRYAQLAGQAVLPAAIWLLWRIAERDQPALGGRRFDGLVIVLAGLTLAGAMLNYYRMPIYYVAFGVAWFFLFIIPTWRLEGMRWLWGILRVGSVAAAAALFLAPWILTLMDSNLAAAVQTTADTSPAAQVIWADYRAYESLQIYVPEWAQWLVGLALVTGLLLGRWRVVLIGVWSALLTAIYALTLVGFPTANYMNSFAVMISLYMPVGVLVGWLAGGMVDFLRQRLPVGQHVVSVAAAGIVLALGVWGTVQQLDLQDKNYQMVFPSDLAAMTWIRENTDDSARFLVQGFRIYRGTSAVGSDAGWWIPQLAQRRNTMPPQYALLNEQPLQPGYPQEIVDIVAELETVTLDSPDGIALLCQYDITHVYMGQGRGMIGAGLSILYTPEELAASPALESLYTRDSVQILGVKAGTCE